MGWQLSNPFPQTAVKAIHLYITLAIPSQLLHGSLRQKSR
jgi:hypothetical protein